ncbi:ankyrin repeat domain-containing protein 26-like [Ictidomys tridecemlineatus]
MIENNYEAHIKNIPEEGGELTEASRQSMKDEVKYDTGNQKSGNLPDNSNPASQKKDVVETLVQAIRIKNDCPFFSSPESKPKQASTDCGVLDVENFHPCLPGSAIGPFSYEESISQILPQSNVGHLFGEAHQRAKDGVSGHTEAEPLCFSSSEEEEEGLNGTKNKQPKIFSEGHPQMCVSQSSGEKHCRAKEKADGHVHDSVSPSKTQKAVLSLQRIIKLKKSHCTQCSLHVKKNAQLDNEIHALKKRVSEFKQENTELKQQLHNLRCTLKEEEAKRKNDDMLHEKSNYPLKEKEKEYNKEDKVRNQPEISACKIDTELESTRNHFNQVSTSDGTVNKLSHKYYKGKDEISMRKLEMDTIKYQNQENKCFVNTEILIEKNDRLPWAHKLNEETLPEIFQYKEQLDIWKAENVVQNFTLESEKQSTERPETESKSHPARPGAAPHYHGESPTPKRHLELAFQRARDKDFGSQEKKNIDVSNLKVSSEIPSQQDLKSEIKISDLENELCETRGTLRVMTLATEQVNRHLKQRQFQLMGMEHRSQYEQRKRDEHLRKQEASREKISKLQSDTTLHEDQLHDYQNKGDIKKDGVINIQTQFYNVIKKLQARNDKHHLVLENKYLELINENNHLKEQLDQYGKEKAEEMDDLTTKMDNASSKHLQLKSNYQYFMQNLFFLKSIHDTFEKIERNQKKLEENVANFSRHTQSTRVEQCQGVQWKSGTEQQATWNLEEKQKQVLLVLQTMLFICNLL